MNEPGHTPLCIPHLIAKVLTRNATTTNIANYFVASSKTRHQLNWWRVLERKRQSPLRTADPDGWDRTRRDTAPSPR